MANAVGIFCSQGKKRLSLQTQMWLFVVVIGLALLALLCTNNAHLRTSALNALDGAFSLSADPEDAAAPSPQATLGPKVKRPYLSPVVKKRVAYLQSWRCKRCGNMLDETFEIDHRTPLWQCARDGAQGCNEISNLDALCKSCHAYKTFIFDRSTQ